MINIEKAVFAISILEPQLKEVNDSIESFSLFTPVGKHDRARAEEKSAALRWAIQVLLREGDR